MMKRSMPTNLLVIFLGISSLISCSKKEHTATDVADIALSDQDKYQEIRKQVLANADAVAAIEERKKADVNFHAGVKEAYNNSVNAGPVISGNKQNRSMAFFTRLKSLSLDEQSKLYGYPSWLQRSAALLRFSSAVMYLADSLYKKTGLNPKHDKWGMGKLIIELTNPETLFLKSGILNNADCVKSCDINYYYCQMAAHTNAYIDESNCYSWYGIICRYAEDGQDSGACWNYSLCMQTASFYYQLSLESCSYYRNECVSGCPQN